MSMKATRTAKSPTGAKRRAAFSEDVPLSNSGGKIS